MDLIKRSNLISALLFSFFLLHEVFGMTYSAGDYLEIEFRTAVDAGKIECFHQTVKLNLQIEVSFQVIESESRFDWLLPRVSNADLTIGFVMKGPDDDVIYHDLPDKTNSHTHTAIKEGDYALCFDNTHASIGSKLINVEIYVYSEDTDNDDRWGYFEDESALTPDEEYEESVVKLKSSLNHIRDELNEMTHFQDQKRAYEKRDFNLITSINSFLDIYCTFSLILLIITYTLQVILIRSFFDENSKLHFLFQPIFRRC